jgi:hypothetical protein
MKEKFKTIYHKKKRILNKICIVGNEKNENGKEMNGCR